MANIFRSIARGITKKITGFESWARASSPGFGLGARNSSAFDSVWAIGGVETIAQNLASLPIVFNGQDGKRVEKLNTEQQQWVNLLTYPDPALSVGQIWELTSMVYDIEGVALWLLLDENNIPISGPLDTPSVIQVYGPRNIVPKYRDRSSNILTGWTLCVGGKQIELGIWQVVRFWKTNPKSYVEGLKLTDKVGTTLSLDHDAKEVNRGFFRRGGRASGTLKMTKRWDKDEALDYARKFKESYAGAENAGGIPLLPEGMDFSESQNNKDMDFKNLYEVNRDEIFGATKVPKHYMGVNDNINRATAEVLDSVFWLNVIRPRAMVFCGIINTRLLYGTGITMEFDFSVVPVLKLQALGVEEMKAKVAARLWRLGYPINEINRKVGLGMEIINQPWANNAHDPAEIASGAQPSGGDGESSTKGIAHPFNSMRSELEKSLKRMNDEKDDQDLAAEGDVEAAERIIRSIEKKTVDKFIPKMKETLRAYFEKLEEAQKEKLNAFFDGKSFIGKSEGDKRELTEGQVDEVLFAQPKWNATLIADIGPIHLQTYLASITTVGEELGGFVSFVQSDAQAASAAAKITSKIVGINQRLAANIKASIIDVIKAGGSRGDVMDAVGNEFKTSYNRISTIARTETGVAMNTARWDVMSVELETKQWVTAKDDGVRDTHKQYGRMKSVPIGYEYAPGLTHPQDNNASAKEVINCRCVLVRGK